MINNKFECSKVRKVIKHQSPMHTKKSQPLGQWIMPETRFRHFSFTLKSGFLCLLHRLMIDSISEGPVQGLHCLHETNGYFSLIKVK